MKKLTFLYILTILHYAPAYGELFDKGSFVFKKVIKNGKVIAQNHSANELTQWIRYDDKIYHCVFNFSNQGNKDELVSQCRD